MQQSNFEKSVIFFFFCSLSILDAAVNGRVNDSIAEWDKILKYQGPSSELSLPKLLFERVGLLTAIFLSSLA